jgi:hypothetical protein
MTIQAKRAVSRRRRWLPQTPMQLLGGGKHLLPIVLRDRLTQLTGDVLQHPNANPQRGERFLQRV